MARELGPKEQRIVLNLTRALEKFKEVDPEMPLQAILLFLAAAARDGQSLSELCASADVAQSTASRSIQKLAGLKTVGDREPLQWLTYTFVPGDYRRKMISLTPQGRRLLDQVLQPLS